MTVSFSEDKTATGQCGAGEVARAGMAKSHVTLGISLDIAAGEAKITVSGPAAVWFGVGINAQAMKDSPWAIIVDGPGMCLSASFTTRAPALSLRRRSPLFPTPSRLASAPSS